MTASMTRRTALASAVAAAALPGLAAPSANMPPDGVQEALFTVQTRDGLELSGAALGEHGAPEILLLHGLGQSRLAWERQRALSRRFRLIAFDLRGHGESSKPDTPGSYGDGALWAADIAAVIETLRLRRPTLVGWSFGGLTIGHYLKRYGIEAIGGVMLAAPVTRMAPDLLGEKALAVGPGLASPDIAVRARAIEETLAATFARPLPDETRRRMLVAGGMAPRALQLGYGALAEDNVDEAFGLPARMGVVYGGRDAITRPEMSQRLLRLNPRATLSIYPDAGHAPFFEDADRFNAELARFAA